MSSQLTVGTVDSCLTVIQFKVDSLQLSVKGKG